MSLILVKDVIDPYGLCQGHLKHLINVYKKSRL